MPLSRPPSAVLGLSVLWEEILKTDFPAGRLLDGGGKLNAGKAIAVDESGDRRGRDGQLRRKLRGQHLSLLEIGAEFHG